MRSRSYKQSLEKFGKCLILCFQDRNMLELTCTPWKCSISNMFKCFIHTITDVNQMSSCACLHICLPPGLFNASKHGIIVIYCDHTKLYTCSEYEQLVTVCIDCCWFKEIILSVILKYLNLTVESMTGTLVPNIVKKDWALFIEKCYCIIAILIYICNVCVCVSSAGHLGCWCGRSSP